MVKGKFTPSEQRTLVKDADGEPPSGMFRYIVVVGMLLYLSGNTRLDIAFTFNFSAQYMFSTKISHELVLNILAQYLNHTQECGLVLDPNSDISKVDTYPDADVLGMYGYKNPNDLACAKNHTGFIIIFFYCPVLCVSKFQTETAFSTMEADIISLDSCF